MDEQLSAILQEQLRDVHLPEAVTWWPLAIGWWILIALTALGVIGLSYYSIKRYRANRYRKQALSELGLQFENWQTEKDNSHYLHYANEILKRTVATFHHEALNQSGPTWAATLNKFGKTPLSKTSQSALTLGCYQAKPEVDIKGLHSELCTWLKQHKVEVKHV